MSFVDNVRGDVLGSLGLIFLLYTTISMVQKVEESFNFVWRVEQPRSLGAALQRIPQRHGRRARRSSSRRSA